MNEQQLRSPLSATTRWWVYVLGAFVIALGDDVSWLTVLADNLAEVLPLIAAGHVTIEARAKHRRRRVEP